MAYPFQTSGIKRSRAPVVINSFDSHIDTWVVYNVALASCIHRPNKILILFCELLTFLICCYSIAVSM